MLAAALLAVGALAVSAHGSAGRSLFPGYCCVGAAPTWTYDAAAKKLTISWVTPQNERTSFLLAKTTGTLDANGYLQGTTVPIGNGNTSPLTVGPDRLSLKGWPQVFWVQVLYSCTLPRDPDKNEDQDHNSNCPGGMSSNQSPPVKIDLTKSSSSSTKQPVSARLGRIPPSNGTKACDVARARIKYVNGEINKALANLKFVDKLSNKTTQRVRRQQLLKRLNDLQRQLTAAEAAAKKAC